MGVKIKGYQSGAAEPQNMFRGNEVSRIVKEPATPNPSSFRVSPSGNGRSSLRHITGSSRRSSGFGYETPRNETPRTTTSSVRTYSDRRPVARDQEERDMTRFTPSAPLVTRHNGFDNRFAAPSSVKMEAYARDQFGKHVHRDMDSYRQSAKIGDNSRFATHTSTSSFGRPAHMSLYQQRKEKNRVTDKLGRGGKKSKKHHKKTRKHRKKTYRKKRR